MFTPEEEEISQLQNLAYEAWTVIANVGLGFEGGWASQQPEWVAAAERWRDKFHKMLDGDK